MPSQKSPHREVIAFRDKETAMQFALVECIFNNMMALDMSQPQVRSLLFFDDVGPTISKAYRKRIKNRLVVDDAIQTRVFYNPQQFDSARNKLPFLIALQYGGGGSAYYFCSSSGHRTSQPLLKRAFPVCVRSSGDCLSMYEFICVVGRRAGSGRSCVYPGCSENLIIKWKDGTVTEEPMHAIFKDCPLEVVHFAEKNNLLTEPGWARVKTASQKYKLIDANREYGHALAMCFPTKRKIPRKRKRKGMSENAEAATLTQPENKNKRPRLQSKCKHWSLRNR